MPRFRRALIALLVGSIIPLVSTRTHAGKVAGGSSAGGEVVIQVDGNPVPNHNFEFDRFYPEVVTVHQGDVVTWKFAPNKNALHTITLLKGGTVMRGGLPPYLRQAFFSPGGPFVADRDDGAQARAYNYNVLKAASCGHSPYYPHSAPCSYTGRSILNSGFIINPFRPGTGEPVPGAPPATYSVRMNTPPGTYLYLCLLHRGMNGIIRVVRRGVPISSAAAVAQQARRLYQADVAKAERVEARARPGRTTVNGHTVWTVLAGIMTDPVMIDSMIPAKLSIKRGDRVRWKIADMHTVTFPSESGLFEIDPTCEGAGLDFLSGWNLSRCPSGFELAIDARASETSGPSGRPYTGGFYNSGTMRTRWSASFPKAGTYHYDCIVHTGMDGSITVS